MSKYFIKKLMKQEMGSPTFKADGKPKFYRGRYLLITSVAHDFFPHLSSTVLNDCTALPIKPYHTDGIVYAQYVYHNSKRIPEEQRIGVADRDERRIYLNNDLDLQKTLFMPDDILVLEKITDEHGSYYAMSLLSPDNFSVYSKLDNILAGKTTTIYEGKLDYIHSTAIVKDVEIKDKKVIEAVEKQQEHIISDPNSIESSMGSELFNSRSFRDFVMLAYGYKGAITRTAINCSGFLNLEAAHIKPQAHNGTFLPCNGIAMGRDMHFAFDKGFFTITPDYRVKIHPKVLETDSFINQYDNAPMYVPTEPFFRPSELFLKHHRELVYGSFQQIQRLDRL